MTDWNSRVTCSGEWASNNWGSRGPCNTLSTFPSACEKQGRCYRLVNTYNLRSPESLVHAVEERANLGKGIAGYWDAWL